VARVRDIGPLVGRLARVRLVFFFFFPFLISKYLFK
jgi:hypothetical protein